MNILALNRNDLRDFDSAYEKDFDDLVHGRRAGHMGHHEYVNSSMPLWATFIQEHGDAYYIPRDEETLIQQESGASARLLGGEPVTLVSRGCGTKFLAKEGELIRHFKNVAGVVYLDRSEAALEQSMAEGRSLLPHAWHKAISCDIYDPSLRYPVEGREVGTSFGMTLLNLEGFPAATAPREAYVRNLSAIHSQMRSGAHFIVPVDHNHDRRTVEQAYAGQTEFARHMLQRTGSLNPDAVDFVVKFHKTSQTLAHGFQFKDDTVVSSRSGPRLFQAGEVLWFNNSVKPAVTETKDWNKRAGFEYARPVIPMEPQNRLGWHHLVKAP